MAEITDLIRIGEYQFSSRLFVGTGKYETFEQMKEAIVASGTELVTVALRRVNLDNPNEPSLLEFIPPGVTILPNTAGCYTVEDAVQVAHLARASGIGTLIKLEVIGDPDLLWPDPVGTLRATEKLVEDGFTVMVYTTPDPVLAVHLEKAGAATVMPLGSPIGSGQGILDMEAIQQIRQRVKVPVVVDAGIGCASDAAVAMDHGADAVLVNTAIAKAVDPVAMARAMRLSVQAGRMGYLAGRMAMRQHAQASSPQEGLVTGRASAR